MAIKIQIRGDTLAAWTAANPILAERELAAETDTQRFKIGDGALAYNSLPYMEVTRELERIAASVSAGVLTLDMNHAHERKFEVGTAQSSAFSIAFANSENAEFIHVVIPITGTVAITLPTNVVSIRLDGRFNNTTKIITVIATGTGDLFEFSFDVMTGPKYILKASDANYPS